MARNLKFTISISKDCDGLEIVAIDVGPIVSAEWCVELCMLEKGVVDVFQIDDVDQGLTITFEIDRELATNARGRILFRHDGVIALRLTLTEIEFWTDYFLNAYRDQIAPVNHIDVDISGDETGTEKGITLILKGMKSVPPISPEEAAKLIDE
jgi:hypothetical protein